jgi:hypothetical protein
MSSETVAGRERGRVGLAYLAFWTGCITRSALGEAIRFYRRGERLRPFLTGPCGLAEERVARLAWVCLRSADDAADRAFCRLAGHAGLLDEARLERLRELQERHALPDGRRWAAPLVAVEFLLARESQVLAVLKKQQTRGKGLLAEARVDWPGAPRPGALVNAFVGRNWRRSPLLAAALILAIVPVAVQAIPSGKRRAASQEEARLLCDHCGLVFRAAIPPLPGTCPGCGGEAGYIPYACCRCGLVFCSKNLSCALPLCPKCGAESVPGGPP